MFGQLEANDNVVLRYSLLYDFFTHFSAVTLYGLPIAQCLAPHFLFHIQSFGDQNRLNQSFINNLRKKYSFFTMGNITEKLVSLESITPVPFKRNKKSILLSDDYESFADEHLKEYDVTLYKGKYKMNDRVKNGRFTYCHLQDEVNKIRNNAEVKKQEVHIEAQLNRQLTTCSNHYYFKKRAFQIWLLATYKKIIRWVSVLESLIQKVKPGAIVVSSEASVYGTILCLLAKKYGIPLLNIPLVAIGDRSLIPARADYYFVWGKKQKEWLLQRHVKESAIIETGNIYFYYKKTKPTRTKQAFYREQNIPSHHLIMTFTTQPLLNANKRIEQWLKTVPIHLPVTIIIKKHRSDQHTYSLIKNQNNVRILPNDYPLYTVLHYSHCVMTIASTTGFEAALLEKPLLILQPQISYPYMLNDNESAAFFAKARAGEVITNEASLVSTIKKINKSNVFMEELTERGRKFVENTILTVDEAPLLVKKHIEEILLK
ncbi:hypothetical protein [Metabacillus iocasae]|uniref:Uncharacterized protein n=1 Tax=Priestia iocasae TaxID=2291674 RepID=A0ABS2QVI9_9BACI|nr:hypothetical protein [Metabacillus iocasae]MBM7703012.1 hypothetical protein [Metabacillus iocasae]